MRAPLRYPQHHGQNRLRAIECLNLGLIYAQHQRLIRWLRYSPTISRTFSMKSGSVES